MTYKKVQFIAYCIHTGPKTIGLKQQYLGIAPTSADIAERIKLVRKAIEVARTNSNTKQSDDETLKIFMMPEFFFRGKEGAYALELITGIQRKSRTWLEWLKGGFLSDLSRLTGYSQPRVEEIGLIGLLQNLVKDQQWKNWIFVFGSIIGSSVETDITDREEVYNLVLVQKGGFGDTPRVGSTFAKVVMKEHVSGMDFIKTSESGGGALLERVFHPLTVNQQQLVKHLKDLLALTEEQLRAAPISFTESEIALWRTSEKARLNDCLTPNSSPQFLPHFLFGLRSGDAYFSALFPLIEKFLKAKLGNVKAQELLLSIRRSEEQQKEYDGSSVFEIDGIRFGLEVCLDHGVRRLKNSKNLPTIDIQLVPSCGAQINEDAIVAKTNGYGYIFHCDGYADYDANWLGYNSGAKRVKATLPHDNIKPSAIENIVATGIRIDEIYAQDAGQIRFYPAQPLGVFSGAKSVFSYEAGYTRSLEDQTVLLNGMKVIFDQPVAVSPVALEEKGKEHPYGKFNPSSSQTRSHRSEEESNGQYRYYERYERHSSR